MRSQLLSKLLVFSGLWTERAATAPSAPHDIRPAGVTERLELSELFNDGMVLSRHDARVFGWAPPGSEISLRLPEPAARATARSASDGYWLAQLGDLPPGGPFTMTVDDSTSQLVREVLVGDVWVFAGQSNAEYSLGRLLREADTTIAADALDFWRTRALEEVERPASEQMRILRLNKTRATAPLHRPDLTHSWQRADADVRADDSLSAILFAENLVASQDLPIGIIQLTAGGTYLREWLPQQALDRLAPLPTGGHPPKALAYASQIFDGMLSPLQGLSVTGMVWTLAESDIESGDQQVFSLLEREMFATARNLFQAPRLPIITVQVADWLRDWRAHTTPDFSHPVHTQWVREAQLHDTLNDRHGALVVTVDLSNPYSVHYVDKWEVARRAALAAQRLAYGEHHAPVSPGLAGYEAGAGALIVFFHHAEEGLCAGERHLGEMVSCHTTSSPLGLEIAGSDGVWHRAHGDIRGSHVVLRHHGLDAPLHARYAWHPFTTANLYSVEGLPVAPWRTDRKPALDPCEHPEIKSARWFCR